MLCYFTRWAGTAIYIAAENSARNICRQALEAGLGAAGKDRKHESKEKARDIMKYRKKPVEIEAVQWTGENASEIHGFAGGSCYR